MRTFKYRGGADDIFERDLKSLDENYFWAPTRHDLNDPFEGLYDKSFLDNQLDALSTLFIFNSKIEQSFSSVKSSFDELTSYVDKAGIYSLSNTPLEELLWAHYGYSHKGFCIEYDIDKLIEFGKHDYKKITVEYSDTPAKLEINDIANIGDGSDFLKKILGFKSLAWKYENEVRVISSRPGKQEYDYRAVKSIYFGLRMSDNHKHKLMRILKNRDIEFYQIVFKPNSYLLNIQSENNPYNSTDKYMYSISPTSDYVVSPEYVNEKYKKYIPYLYKAVEIVRREPYCHIVLMAEFSSSKGTIEHPIIFVQYQKSDEKYINHYFSIPEIDEQFGKISDLDAESYNKILMSDGFATA